jgi:hypothetical protein
MCLVINYFLSLIYFFLSNIVKCMQYISNIYHKLCNKHVVHNWREIFFKKFIYNAIVIFILIQYYPDVIFRSRSSQKFKISMKKKVIVFLYLPIFFLSFSFHFHVYTIQNFTFLFTLTNPPPSSKARKRKTPFFTFSHPGCNFASSRIMVLNHPS